MIRSNKFVSILGILLLSLLFSRCYLISGDGSSGKIQPEVTDHIPSLVTRSPELPTTPSPDTTPIIEEQTHTSTSLPTKPTEAVPADPIKLAWFYKPPANVDLMTLGNLFDFFVLTQKDEHMKYIFIFLIKVYQRTLSRALPASCRFYPSCSEYGVQALQKHGVFKGSWLTVKRIARCHPFNPGGYDPVP